MSGRTVHMGRVIGALVPALVLTACFSFPSDEETQAVADRLAARASASANVIEANMTPEERLRYRAQLAAIGEREMQAAATRCGTTLLFEGEPGTVRTATVVAGTSQTALACVRAAYPDVRAAAE